MRIAIDCRPLVVAPYSGIARQVSAMCQVLTEHPDVEIFRCTDAPLTHPAREFMCCPSWDAPAQGMHHPGVRWNFEARFLPEFLKREDIDLYIATVNMGIPIGYKSRTRYAVLVHDLFQLTERNFHQSRIKALVYRGIDYLSISWAVAKADAIWCPSRFTMGTLAQYFPRTQARTHLLPNHVPAPDHIGSRPDYLPQRYWLLVGTRELRKNIRHFLETWLVVSARCTVPELVLVGNPVDFPQFQNIEGVHWLHEVPESDMAAVYRYAECLWQPSFAEGFGLPVLEALSVGTPVAVATGSALDEITPSDMPRFDPFSVEDLARCMTDLARAPLLRDRPEHTNWVVQYAMDAYGARLRVLIEQVMNT